MRFKKIKKKIIGILIILIFPLTVNSFALCLFLKGELSHIDINRTFGAVMLMIAVAYNLFFSSTAISDFLEEGECRQSQNIVFIKLSYFITCAVPLLIIALLIFISI